MAGWRKMEGIIYISFIILYDNIPQTPKVLETVGTQWPAPIMHITECLEGR